MREKMKTNFNIKIILVVLIAIFLFSNLKAQNEYEVILDFVKINTKLLEADELKDIVLARNDSITVGYKLKTEAKEKTPFIFRVKLQFGDEISSRPINTTSLTYTNLNEGEYKLTIDAFDPRNQWKAAPLNLNFRVNDREAKLRKEITALKDSLMQKKEAIKDTTTITKAELSGIDIKSSLIGFGIGIFLFIFILLIKSKTNKKSKSKNETGIDMENNKKISVFKEQYDKLLSENSNLRAEIASLRGQIDAMQARANELSKQNQELKDTVDRLSKSQQEFEELQKQKDELFAIIIHDIKNPAALIKSLVELLRSYDLTATEQQEIIEDIIETTSKIVTLSQEVSRILALESSVIKLDLDTLQINDIIKDVARRNQIMAGNKNIEMLFDLDEKIPLTLLDHQKIDEVIDNLISNAIKFSHKNGSIRLKSYELEGNIVVEVSDNGLGLSEEDIKEAFQRGARLSAKPTGGEPSSGFGLWIVKKLVEAHRGRVWVKSTLGKGSTFAFSIPIKEPEPKNNNNNNS